MSEWEMPDPAEVLTLGAEPDWNALNDRYRGQIDRPFARCLEVARANGAVTAVIETRYIDPDYRSEYTAFFARTFAPMPDSTHRIHFFKAPLNVRQLWKLPQDHGYLGYIVARPSSLGAVGRSVLTPPPGLVAGVRTAVRDPVNFFGANLEVEGAPFVQQDTQLGRCAHAAAWMCHYTGFRRGDAARRYMAEFSLSVTASLGTSRPIPSEGLTVLQLLELLGGFGMPASFYNVKKLPPSRLAPWGPPDPQPPANNPDQHPGFWDTRIVRIACRYLNSGLPVLVGTRDHAFVLTGYVRNPGTGDSDWITFIRHDDQRGPYLQVGDVLNDFDPNTQYVYSPWDSLIVPLPEKLWLPPEPVEQTGALLMHSFADKGTKNFPEAQTILDLAKNRKLRARTYALPSNQFKSELEGRVDPALVREYRLARMSRYVWVVEAIDQDLRRAGEPCVLGEAIFDATSSETNPLPLAVHVPGFALVHRFNEDARFPIRCAPDPYESGGVGPP